MSRSVLRSWGEAGLGFAAGAAYDLEALVAIVLLAECRDYLSPKELVGAWRRLNRTGGDGKIIEAARELQPGGRFDLIVDQTYNSLTLARDDAELAEAVRRARPRPMVVLDMAERVFEAVEHFADNANEGSEPKKKGPGRPRSAERGLRIVNGGRRA